MSSKPRLDRRAGDVAALARTGTTVRTVERDIARLVDAGVPVQVKRGPGGGYRLDTRRRLPPLELTPGEVSALVASLVAVGPYISAAAQSALGKLLTALTPDGGDPGRSPVDTGVSIRSGMVP